MITLSVISVAAPGRELLDDLRRYAAVPDESQDALLLDLLQRAALVVQEYADESFLPCTFRMDVHGNGGGRVRLYQDVSRVVSVTDGVGNAVPFSLSGRILIPERSTEDLSVVYDTMPEEGGVARLRTVVIRYATALYDGLGRNELDSIISEVC